MCFYHDYDWHAEESDSAEGPGTDTVRCEECRCLIHPGEWRRWDYLRQYECCKWCHGDGCAECDDGRNPDVGGTAEWNTCERCARLLDAIRAVEEAEGCQGDQTQPHVGGLFDALAYDEESSRYVDAAMLADPSLANHLWRFGQQFHHCYGWCDQCDGCAAERFRREHPEFFDLGGES